ncbi:MAG TPA: PP0621 family protein, partial [Thermoanaerobaculia bacterium]|nr:PP0621 family protein [Thermoanaerobaculia bacterium]
MLRLLALFAVAMLLWLVLESSAAFVRGRLTGRRPASRIPPSRPARTVAMDLVRCAGCGIHVPRQRALQAGDAIYCSEACR